MKVIIEMDEMGVCEIVKAIIRTNPYNKNQYELCLIQPEPMKQAYVVSMDSREEALNILGRLASMTNGCVNLSKKPTREAVIMKNFAGVMTVGD